jgi:acyl-CoA reductase-like NAD-dependent aldehyde dehydrogenase
VTATQNRRAEPPTGDPVVADGILVSTDPATGEEVGRFPVADGAAVDAAVAVARDAAAWWRGLGAAGRRQRLLDWRTLIVRRLDELVALVHQENGKPRDDAAIELVATVIQLDWAARNAARVLAPRRVRPGLFMVNQAACVEYPPLGVVGAIGPWNYPLYTPMGSIGSALAAGNAVVYKPSEHTPAVAAWLAATFAEVVPERPVLQVVHGLGDVGAALCRAGVDLVAFTGSGRTGRRVMAACAETLTPVVLECGGKDALLVDADADLDAAADAAAWGGFLNAGQTCVGVERVYVHAAVYEPFLNRLADRARRLAPGSGPDADYGPATAPSQVDVVRRHVADALARGARAVVGGTESVRPPFVHPVVLADVPDDAAAVREETFGPTLTVRRVDDLDEAVRLVNAGPYGLSATVFSRRRGVELARALRAGMVAVNGILSFTGVGGLPFGGVGESGFGRVQGADGLRAFTRPQAISRQRFAWPVPVYSFDRSARTDALLLRLARLRFGRTRR